jgi:hypothetical protein
LQRKTVHHVIAMWTVRLMRATVTEHEHILTKRGFARLIPAWCTSVPCDRYTLTAQYGYVHQYDHSRTKREVS